MIDVRPDTSHSVGPPISEEEAMTMVRERKGRLLVLLTALALALAACGGDGASEDTTAGEDTGTTEPASSGDLVTVGFAQTGSESGWRSANTESMQAAFSEENGFELVFNAADNDPAAQIAAVRSFINQGVDAIVIAPIVEDGWEDVLQEAQDAGIPVILEDRTVTASEDLYATWVGLDFRNEGVMAGEWAAEQFGDTPTRMVVLEGTTGSAPANDRAEGFDEAVAGTAIEKIDSQTGDFTRDGGKTVMEGFLQVHGVDGIDLVYAHNDDMALGAIEAIEAAGGTPGEDIQIVSIDAVHDGMQALIDGKINFIVECNPLLGELAAGLVTDVLAGSEVDKRYYVEDQTFTQEQAAEVIDERLY
jgi:ABC-type sugar transport system substrate-binding protein